MKVAVVGAGYVGLVTSAGLAEIGHDVVCVDVDPAKVAQISAGEVPQYEEGLAEILRRHIGHRLRATCDLPSAVAEAEVTLIAVGSPDERRDSDLTQIRAASSGIGAALRDKAAYHVVAVKSTVPPGTTEEVVGRIVSETSGRDLGDDFGLAMNPEFLRQGSAVQDFLNPDRIVIGAIDGRAADVLVDLYAPFAGAEIVRTNPRTAELIKYASNALLATLISYSNELADLAAGTPDVDVVDVLRAVRLDDRWAPRLDGQRRVYPAVLSYLEAGCGFGGSCLPKDLNALVSYGDRIGAATPLLEAVRETNERRPSEVVSLLQRSLSNLGDSDVAVLGLSFKPGTDDVRESPALPIVRLLLDLGASVRVFDPVVETHRIGALDRTGVEHAENLAAAVDGVDAIVVVTAWDAFRELPGLLRRVEAQPVVVDGRRMFEPDDFARYVGVGAGAS